MLPKIQFLIFVLFFQTLLAAPAFSNERTATVDGFCFLEDESDHSGAMVLFLAVSPSAETDSTLTDATGYYQLGLSEGIYSVHYSKDGYDPYTLPGDQLFSSGTTTLPDVTLIPLGPFEASGNVSGTWAAGTEYAVIGDVTIQDGDSLFIEAGVTVVFMGEYELLVNGGLYANGTEVDSVVFTSGQPIKAPGDYWGIQFSGASCRAQLVYCVIEYAGMSNAGALVSTDDADLVRIEHSAVRFSENAGIYCTGGSSPAIVNSSFQHNGYIGIWCGSGSGAPLIEGNIITENELAGVYCYAASPPISNNTISANLGVGIYCKYSLSLITGNSISYNASHGVYCEINSQPQITNNTIKENADAGVFMASQSNPAILANIIVENGFGINADSSPGLIEYNDVWGNDNDYVGGSLPPYIGEIITVNSNGDPCDSYFNISMDPEFRAPDDFRLESTSPCIDAGPEDILDPDGTRTDLGAYYFDQLLTSTQPEVSDPALGRLLWNYPNPFNPHTTISFTLNAPQHVRIAIHDVTGRKIAQLTDSIAQKGRNEVVWDGTANLGQDVASGVYFVRMQAEAFSVSKKIVLVR